MSDNVQKPKKRKEHANSLRNQKLLTKIAQGETITKVAQDMNLSTKQVSRILNSQEVKDIVARGESEIASMVEDAIKVVRASLNSPDEKLATDTATKVLKSVGVLKDKVDINHTFPKPTVIHKRDGSQVIVGVKKEGEE